MDQTIYRLGAELLSVRKFVEKHPEAAALYTALQQMTSAVDISGLPSSPSPSTQTDDRFIAEIALGLIGRGWPTISSPFVEEALLSRLDPDSGLSIAAGPEHEVTWRLTADADRNDEWVEAFSHALLPTDSRLRPWGENLLPLADSQTEKRFYFEVLPRALGPLHSCVEWQRPLESMVEAPKELESIVNRRSDFTIELPAVGDKVQSVRVNLEVDGPSHETGKNPVIDQSRDPVLRRAKWHLERIKAKDVTSAWHLPDILHALLVTHPVMRAASVPRENLTAVASVRTSELLLTPHAVARIQLAVLLALRDGRLSLAQGPWFLLVREREVSAAYLALADLRRILGHLCDLYGLPKLPEVSLTIEADYSCDPETSALAGTSENDPAIQAAYVPPGSSKPRDFDLAIDVSVLCRPTQYYGDEQFNDGWVRLRTALRSAGAETLTWSEPREIAHPRAKEQSLIYFLHYAFRKKKFRDDQLSIIERALQRKSVIGLLPTGAGKSLTYQLPALLTPGITFVVDPIKSLMQDQVDNLHTVGTTSAIWINSDLEGKERSAAERLMSTGTFRFIFISPERLQIKKFLNHVAQLVNTTPVAFATIDEAHCVSEWGHDFRTAYLNLGRNIRTHLTFSDAPPPMIALTGTASRQVLIDVQREIDVQEAEAVIEPKSYDRPELHFRVVKTRSQRKHLELETILAGLAENLERVGFQCSQNDLLDGRQAGIVFCSFVGGDYGVAKVAQNLRRTAFGPKVEVYSGKKPKNLHFLNDSEWSAHKSRTQRAFKNDELAILVATSAFGMGIDKPNVRFTVHYGTPKSLEALAQEAGRAGRDQLSSLCYIISSTAEGGANPDPIEPELQTNEARLRLSDIPKNYQDDAMRSLYLHLTGYLGAPEEARDVISFYRWRIKKNFSPKIAYRDAEPVFASSSSVKYRLRAQLEAERLLGEMGHGDEESDSDDGDTPSVTDLARIVYRLSLLGVVRDYTVEYINKHDSQYTIVPDDLCEEELLQNLRRYVERYDRVDAWKIVEEDHAKAVGDHVEKAIWALSHFVYRAIERRRREAIWNVRDVLKNCRDDDDFRVKLAAYFGTTTFGPRLAQLRQGASDIETVHEIASNVHSAGDAQQLLGQTRRALESDPGNPSLRVISGLARSAIDNPDPADAAASLMLGFAGEREQRPDTATAFIGQALDDLRSLSADLFAPIVIEALRPRDDAVVGVAESAEELGILALPRTNDVVARLSCARTIARRLERESATDARESSATVRKILRTWHDRAPGQIDGEVREVLHSLRQGDSAQTPPNRAYAQFAISSYRLVQDDDLKRACATPILQTLHRAVQHVL